jgi:uncharacterized protein YciU (UPF0263 family)
MKGKKFMQLSPEQVQSVNILLSAVQVAQRRGAFSLQDAHTLQDAIDKLVPREEQERQAAEAQSSDLSGDDAEASVSLPTDDHVHDGDCCDVDTQPSTDAE